ncbi:reprolysin-like metallopeptidase [uncultured Maribacter sp.]|uniref:zinc-dependent metalloprotease n=1 Tax=uncultured Maribacter sp. TaxID=431308 RepID=UPI002616757E|nr:zinc-dependent metalloprotease family protein [uncultured Maribacter sp.]
MLTKLRLLFSITIVFLSFYGSAQSSYWKQEVPRNALKKSFSQRFRVKNAKTFSLDAQSFRESLSSFSKNESKIVFFPDENGKQNAYLVKESSVLSPELALKYPNIKSYVGYDMNNPKDRIRFSISHNGIQSMVIHGDKKGNTYIEKADKNKYISFRRDESNKTEKDFICNTTSKMEAKIGPSALKPVDDQILRKFRLAVSTTGEYTDFHGGTVADALAAINATVTRINEVFETDLAITLELVTNTDLVIYTDAATDPYESNLNTEVQNTLSNIIGGENYDIGHLFHVDAANGNAGFVGAVCSDAKKGSAFSSHPNPVGDLFDLDYVAHEMGHQFGANHTWSHESEGTQVQAEPASGTTIMGYAGIVGANNVASNGEAYYHYNSIVQITQYLSFTGCAEEIALTNTPPVVDLTGNFTIPKSTPFVLKGNATDIDATDVLTYTWEQIDDGVVTQSTFGPTNISGANFRSQKPTINPERYFPKLSSVISGNLTQTMPPINSAWETLSDVERELNFALTVRDNAPGGGQVVSDLVTVSVVNNAGPFLVTSQTTNEIYKAGDTHTITWDVANTNIAPVLTSTVSILLSLDGGQTFDIVLTEDAMNDGEHKIIIPNANTTEARIMVKANNNIYFAVNSSDFTIEESEVILNFSDLEYEICVPNDLTTTFNYETYLGFSEESTFSIVSPPAGLDIAITPNTATLTNTEVTLDFTNTLNLAPGTYPIQVLSTSATQTKTVTLDLHISNSNFTDVVLQTPINNLLDASTNTEITWTDNVLYTSYDIEIATDELFANIVETTNVTSNSYTPVSLQYETTYYWRVKPKNICGEGNFSAPFSFTTIKFSCNTKNAIGLPLEITAEGTPTINSKISFYEDVPLSDIKVSLELDHNYLADLVVTLISPQGTKIILVSSSCGDLKNINAIFDDSANAFSCGGNPAITGTVKPLGNLSSLQGESIKGDWTLQISDNANDDGGFLKAFSIEICVEGELRPDEDNDGVFDDGDDLCLGTPAGLEVDETGCTIYLFPSTNFTVTSQSEACRNNNDGKIIIDATLPLDYEITINGNGINSTENFTTNHTLNDLGSGTYNICINGTDGNITYENHCFEVVITEPEVLNVSSKQSLDGKQTILNLSGSTLYNIELNGVVTQTNKSEVILDLKGGANTLKVYTNIPCQGVHKEQLFAIEQPIIYPNPFNGSTTLFLGNYTQDIEIKIFTSSAQLISSKNYNINNTELNLDFTSLPTGIYFISYKGEALKGTVKVIKQ